MTVGPGEVAGESIAERALAGLAREGELLAEDSSPSALFQTLVEAAAAATEADVAVARILAGDQLVARAVAASSAALAVEIEATRFPITDLPAEEATDLDRLPVVVRRLASRAEAAGALLLPARLGGRVLGCLELLRTGQKFGDAERRVGRLAAAQLALLVASAAEGNGSGPANPAAETLELAGEALLAGAGERPGVLIARLAAEAAGAHRAALWRVDGGGLELAASVGESGTSEIAADVLAGQDAVVATAGARKVVGLPLGRPPFAALELEFDQEPTAAELQALTSFAAQAAEALLSSERLRSLALELDRTRALLAVVGQAITQVSLAHTLETAVDQIAQLLDVECIGIYLCENGTLKAAAGRNLTGPHDEVAERLLELLLGPFRARGMLVVPRAVEDTRLAPVHGAAQRARIEAVHAVPLVVHGDAIGLLAVYLQRGRVLAEREGDLLVALAGQLAVAAQNMRLHEEQAKLSEDLQQALAAERVASRQRDALFEISRSFAETLSLERTLKTVVEKAVDLLGLDAAVIRMPDPRGETLVAQAIHVRDERMAGVIDSIFGRPQLIAGAVAGRLLDRGRPLRLNPERAAALAGSHELLVPFLQQGSTAVVVPLAGTSEVLATLTLLALDPGVPIDDEVVETAQTLAQHAGLAVQNALLLEQQKQFSDSMQRSLLPRERPRLRGLEIGDVYESSARVEVGGDLYDYLLLDDGTLAVVLGDVTGHGVEAAADMAMVKFVFRSVAREHPEPGEFLARANDIVCGELGVGKFVTVLYLIVDTVRGELGCASGGHPAPRLLLPSGPVEPVPAAGLALGIAEDQTYETVRTPFEPDATVVLFTDGVIEARRGRELYGEDRLDAFLAAHRELPAQQLASSLLEDCRQFSGGELPDDCAVVVLRRTR